MGYVTHCTPHSRVEAWRCRSWFHWRNLTLWSQPQTERLQWCVFFTRFYRYSPGVEMERCRCWSQCWILPKICTKMCTFSCIYFFWLVLACIQEWSRRQTRIPWVLPQEGVVYGTYTGTCWGPELLKGPEWLATILCKYAGAEGYWFLICVSLACVFFASLLQQLCWDVQIHMDSVPPEIILEMISASQVKKMHLTFLHIA